MCGFRDGSNSDKLQNQFEMNIAFKPSLLQWSPARRRLPSEPSSRSCSVDEGEASDTDKDMVEDDETVPHHILDDDHDARE